MSTPHNPIASSSARGRGHGGFRVLALLLLVCAGGVGLLQDAALREQLLDVCGREPLKLSLGKSARSGTFVIPLHSPEELDFLTKAQILSTRKKYAEEVSHLLVHSWLRPEYAAEASVFGAIEDKKAW